MRTISRLLGGFVLVVAAAACGGGGSDGAGPPPPPPPPPPTPCAANTFCMTAATFNPTSRTVTSGTTVNWLNDSGVIHNVTFANPAVAGVTNIPDHGSGTNSRVFTAAGTHGFQCTIHAPGMTGSVVVQ